MSFLDKGSIYLFCIFRKEIIRIKYTITFIILVHGYASIRNF
jgi:hypothetical protein